MQKKLSENMPKSQKLSIFYGQSEQTQQHALTPLNVRFERKKTMNLPNLQGLFGATSSKTLAPGGRFSKSAPLQKTLKMYFARKKRINCTSTFYVTST